MKVRYLEYTGPHITRKSEELAVARRIGKDSGEMDAWIKSRRGDEKTERKRVSEGSS